MTATTPRKTTRKPAVKPTAKTEAEGTATPFAVNLLGRDWHIAADALDDFELLERLTALDAGGPRAMAALPAVLRALLGDVQYAEAMNLLRDDKTGRVSMIAGSEFAAEIIAELNPNS